MEKPFLKIRNVAETVKTITEIKIQKYWKKI